MKLGEGGLELQVIWIFNYSIISAHTQLIRSHISCILNIIIFNIRRFYISSSNQLHTYVYSFLLNHNIQRYYSITLDFIL